MSDQYTDPARWDLREDGSVKGTGFLGLLQRPDGRVSSELSIGTEDVVPGKEVEIPLLVPTLTADEVRYLLSAPPGDSQNPTMQTIARKATDFARQRLAQGQPVFAGPGEANHGLLPQFPRANVTAPGASFLTPAHGTTPIDADALVAAIKRLAGRP